MSLVTDGNPGDSGLITITNRGFRFTGYPLGATAGFS